MYDCIMAGDANPAGLICITCPGLQKILKWAPLAKWCTVAAARASLLLLLFVPLAPSTTGIL